MKGLRVRLRSEAMERFSMAMAMAVFAMPIALVMSHEKARSCVVAEACSIISRGVTRASDVHNN